MKFLILLAFVAFVAAMDDDHKKIYKEWKNHVEKYNRKYHNDDHARKGFENFARTYAQVQEHNRRFRAGVETFEAGFNQFSDMNEEERAKYNGFNYQEPAAFHVNKRNIDTTLQYRSTSGYIYKQIVSSGKVGTAADHSRHTGTVRDQGQCGSCYSFASNKVVEMNARKLFNVSLNLGPQHVVDCSSAFGNKGCNGGFFTNVLDYWMNFGGCLIEETTYPYKAAVQTKTATECKAMCDASKVKVKINGYVVAKPNDLAAVKTLLDQGPCFAAIYVSPNSPLYTYKSGIINDPSVGNPNHAVVAVGYGKDNTTEYITILNSWASTWGNKGFANIPVNQIQILSSIFYPNVTLSA